jgi:hypothetical protein
VGLRLGQGFEQGRRHPRGGVFVHVVRGQPGRSTTAIFDKFVENRGVRFIVWVIGPPRHARGASDGVDDHNGFAHAVLTGRGGPT